jgi:hypothetical protein
MPRLRYATPEDVARRYDPNITGSEIDTDDFLGTEDDRETITARLEGIESQWDREATPMRAVSVGSEDAPKYFDAKGSPWPVRIYLSHQNVQPLDSNRSDFIKTRTGRDSYTDITHQQGSAWTADWDAGIISVYKLPGAGQLPAFRRIREKFVKLSYHIAAGGDVFSAGETTLGEDIDTNADGTVSVTDASRLPHGDALVLVGGSEYVYLNDVDPDADTVTIAKRGLRKTTTNSHNNGTTVHYCPMNVREAVAALGAVELASVEDFTEALFDGSLDLDSKIDQWEAEWNRAVNSYSDQVGYD